MSRACGARRRTRRTRWRARAGALVLSSDRQTTAASLRANKALPSVSASAENTWAAQPRRCSRWASNRAAVSSNSLRPAMQTTDPPSSPIPFRSAAEIGLRKRILEQIIEHSRKPLLQPRPPLGRQRATVAVGLRPHQHRDRHRVEKLGERCLLGEFFGLLGCLFRVIGEHALIERFLGGERRLVAQQDIEEAQLRNVPAEHDHAGGQRRRQQQSNRAP